MQEHKTSISAEEVYKILLEQGSDIGLATVYRVLNQFDEAHILIRHNFEGNKSVLNLHQQNTTITLSVKIAVKYLSLLITLLNNVKKKSVNNMASN